MVKYFFEQITTVLRSVRGGKFFRGNDWLFPDAPLLSILFLLPPLLFSHRTAHITAPSIHPKCASSPTPHQPTKLHLPTIPRSHHLPPNNLLRLLWVLGTRAPDAAANQIRSAARTRSIIIRIRKGGPRAGFKECLRRHARRLGAITRGIETNSARASRGAGSATVVPQRDVAAGKVGVLAGAYNLFDM